MSDNRCGGQNTAIARMVYHLLSSMEFCKAGKIVKFHAADNLADVQPVVKEKFYKDGKPEYRALPITLRAPVELPYSAVAELCVTVPIREGDPCMILFSDRMLDNFIKEFAKGGGPVNPECCGGDNKTSKPRIHHLTDGICVPGLHGVRDAIPEWNNDAIELRNKKRTAFISLTTNGVINIKAPGGVNIDAPKVDATGKVIGKELKTHEGFDANTHLHSDVMSGNANTGPYV